MYHNAMQRKPGTKQYMLQIFCMSQNGEETKKKIAYTVWLYLHKMQTQAKLIRVVCSQDGESLWEDRNRKEHGSAQSSVISWAGAGRPGVITLWVSLKLSTPVIL